MVELTTIEFDALRLWHHPVWSLVFGGIKSDSIFEYKKAPDSIILSSESSGMSICLILECSNADEQIFVTDFGIDRYVIEVRQKTWWLIALSFELVGISAFVSLLHPEKACDSILVTFDGIEIFSIEDNENALFSIVRSSELVSNLIVQIFFKL